MLNIAVWLVVGAVIGGVAAMLMRGDDDPGVFVNVIVGVAGALGAGWWVAPRIGVRVPAPRVFNLGALAAALIGAALLLALTSVVRGRKRRD